MSKVNYKAVEMYVAESFNVDRLEETGMSLTTPEDICKAFKRVFHAEYYCPENLRYYGNNQEVLKSYLQGLPSSINIDYENYRIIELAILWNSLSVNATEKQQDKIIENYFAFMAWQIVKYCRKNKVELFDK